VYGGVSLKRGYWGGSTILREEKAELFYGVQIRKFRRNRTGVKSGEMDSGESFEGQTHFLRK
jgi:hypothetical protein